MIILYRTEGKWWICNWVVIQLFGGKKWKLVHIKTICKKNLIKTYKDKLRSFIVLNMICTYSLNTHFHFFNLIKLSLPTLVYSSNKPSMLSGVTLIGLFSFPCFLGTSCNSDRKGSGTDEQFDLLWLFYSGFLPVNSGDSMERFS